MDIFWNYHYNKKVRRPGSLRPGMCFTLYGEVTYCRVEVKGEGNWGGGGGEISF